MANPFYSLLTDRQRGAVALLMWYTVNISTVILNKWLYTRVAFNYPLTLTLCHMGACAVLGFLCIRVFGLMDEVPVTPDDRLRRILPMSAIFVFNIVLGNVSLAFVPVSFMQTIKSSVPFFTYTLQLVLARRVFHGPTAASLVPVVCGVALASWAEVNFNMTGFACAAIASVTTALQSIIGAQLLAGRLKMDPVNLVFNMAPIAFLLTLPMAYYREWAQLSTDAAVRTTELVVLLTISSVVAFTLNFAVFFAIKHTSALTFTVAGNFKVVLVIVISVAIFRNEISWLNAVGIAITIIGCWIYNSIQFQANQAKVRAAAGGTK